MDNPLTQREQEALSLYAQGLTQATVAERQGVKLVTVKKRMENIRRKLQVQYTHEAILVAAKANWID